jgi:hypothetical protein
MTVPVWLLVGLATWTVLLLLAMVGVYRWSRILTGRVPIRSFRADQIEGANWYLRAMRHTRTASKTFRFLAQLFWGAYCGMAYRPNSLVEFNRWPPAKSKPLDLSLQILAHPLLQEKALPHKHTRGVVQVKNNSPIPARIG